ncbi:hypothetical protein [Treponema pectinovorum]|nr:hypothetical protein [Treponema pectinovorum]
MIGFGRDVSFEKNCMRSVYICFRDVFLKNCACGAANRCSAVALEAP